VETGVGVYFLYLARRFVAAIQGPVGGSKPPNRRTIIALARAGSLVHKVNFVL
jgi:hypothetical protein